MVNTNLRLEAMERQQQTIERLGAAGILVVVQMSSVIFRSVKGRYFAKRSGHNRRFHPRQWRGDDYR